MQEVIEKENIQELSEEVLRQIQPIETLPPQTLKIYPEETRNLIQKVKDELKEGKENEEEISKNFLEAIHEINDQTYA